MFKNYLQIALRNIRRNRLFTGINIFGLTTGLTSSILIFLWVQDELSFDRFVPGADHIVRITATVKDIGTANVPPAFATATKSEMPLVKNATRITSLQKIVTVGARKFDEKRMYYADSNFLRIFGYPLLRGDRTTVLSAPNTVTLTEATAIRYFGGVDQAMGKSIYIDNDIKGSSLQVTGILKDIPENSHLQFDLLLSMDNWDRQIGDPQPWRYFDSYVYFQLADRAIPDAATLRTMERQLNTIRNKAIVNTPAVPATIAVQRLTDIHLYSHYSQDVPGQGNIRYVRIFLIVAIFIIFIACVNFMNLATALSGTRAKEVGLRKTIGALRSQLILQFIGESMLLAFVSLVLALVLVRIALPYFNTLAGKSIAFDLLDFRLTGKTLIITIVVGLLAGSYPAFYMSSFNATKVLKGERLLKNKGSFLRNGLFVLQFAISVILMISAIIIYKQLSFLHYRDIGFNRENLLYIPMPEVGDLKDNADALRSSLDGSSRIGDYSIISDLPTNLVSPSPLIWRGMDSKTLILCNRMNVDENFLRTFGMKMAAGRFYSRDFKGNDSAFVLNEAAVRAMQLDPDHALGKIITFRGQEGKIIGVIRDFNFAPLYQPIEPLVIRRRNSGDYLVIRTAAGSMQQTLTAAQDCFQKVYGNIPFSYGFIDQDLDHLYASENRMGLLFNIFSVLSIIISCLGLFGLATFATQRRTKEIGIRRVLGAGEAGIVILLAKEFLRLVSISLLIAFPIAWYVLHQWLQGFAEKIDISGWPFAMAGGAALLVAILTVSYQTIRAALMNPVKSLRNE